MRGLPSASALDRANACPASAALPGVHVSSAYSDAGVAIHAYIDRARKLGKSVALVDVEEEWRDRCAAIDLDALPAGLEGEVAFGFDLATGRAVRYSLDEHRGYPDDGLLHGTADLVGRTADRVIVYDVKTGNAARASESLQLAKLALSAARYAGVDEAEAGMLILRANGDWIVDRHRLDAFALLDVEAKLRSIAERVEAARATYDGGGMPETSVGDHCGHCPALRVCPATSALVRTAAAWEVDTIADRMRALSDEDAGRAYQTIVLVEKIAEAAKKALRERARISPIPIPGGKVLRECAWSVTVKSDAAKAELAKLGADLERRGEITKQKTTQVRVVAAPKKSAA